MVGQSDDYRLTSTTSTQPGCSAVSTPISYDSRSLLSRTKISYVHDFSMKLHLSICSGMASEASK